MNSFTGEFFHPAVLVNQFPEPAGEGNGLIAVVVDAVGVNEDMGCVGRERTFLLKVNFFNRKLEGWFRIRHQLGEGGGRFFFTGTKGNDGDADGQSMSDFQHSDDSKMKVGVCQAAFTEFFVHDKQDVSILGCL